MLLQYYLQINIICCCCLQILLWSISWAFILPFELYRSSNDGGIDIKNQSLGGTKRDCILLWWCK